MSVQERELQESVARAERAEAEVARLKKEVEPESGAATRAESGEPDEAEAQLRKDTMMSHLLDSLADGKDIGHYGRLVFAMVARHFLAPEEVVSWLTRDSDFSEAQARAMLTQVEGRDYNPPRRERILEWQAQQEFPILPYPEDPDCGNLYRNLRFPESIYGHIEKFHEKKASAA
jgi:hypothetical protein